MGKMCYRCMKETIENGVCPICGEPALSAEGNGDNALPPGTTLGKGRLTVGKKLGSGGFGVTYIAFDSKLNRRVALKEFMPNYLAVRQGIKIVPKPNQDAAYQKAMNSFQKEARTLYELRAHPNIVHVLSVFQENNTAYYTMEMLEGESFLNYLRRKKKISAERSFKILLPIMDAIHFTHSKKILHRDISPDNVMLCDDKAHPGRRIPKLIDFGAAHVAIEGFSLSYPGVKKNGFSPLEQNWDGKYQGPWTDVYAFCAMFYSSIVGNVPVAAMERADADHDPLKPPSQLGADISPELEAVLMRGLKLKYQERTQNMEVLMRDMAAALNKDVGSIGGGGPSTVIEVAKAVPVTASRPVGRRIGAWILETALFLGTMIGLNLDFWQKILSNINNAVDFTLTWVRDPNKLLLLAGPIVAFWLLDWILMMGAGGTLCQLIFGLKGRREDGEGNPGPGGSLIYALFYNSLLILVGFILGLVWLASGKSIGPLERMANITIGRRNERQAVGMGVVVSQGVSKSVPVSVGAQYRPDEQEEPTIGPQRQPPRQPQPQQAQPPAAQPQAVRQSGQSQGRVSGQNPGASQAVPPQMRSQAVQRSGQSPGVSQAVLPQMRSQAVQRSGQSQAVRPGGQGHVSGQTPPAQGVQQRPSGQSPAQGARPVSGGTPSVRAGLLVKQTAETAANLRGMAVELHSGDTLGKNPAKAKIAIPDQTVSGLHCAFIYTQDRGWMIEDKGSTNGTFIGEMKLAPNTPVSLKSGAVVKIGKEVLEFRLL